MSAPLQAARLTTRTRWPLYVASMLVANLIGAMLVYSFIRYGLPITRTAMFAQYARRTDILFVVVVLVGGILSLTASYFMLRPVVEWTLRGGPPRQHELTAALLAPLRQAIVHLVLWAVGGTILTVFAFQVVREIVATVVISIVMGATLMFGFTYLLGERILRPVAAKALSQSELGRLLAPGVGTRMMLTWGLGTFAPATAVLVLSVSQLQNHLFTADGLALTTIAVTCVVIVSALSLSLLTTASIADPIGQLRVAIEQVQAGAHDVEVEVFDGSELGRLQVGFNRMMAEASERRRLQELFGRHVGEDVARRAVETGTELGGESRFVAVLFVDMVGSTTAASERPPNEVVDLLNEFFRVVVETVDKHHGFVNKFMGDAALAIFGAPLDRPDAPTSALAAAREMRPHLQAITGLDVGIGVSAGLAVAGNIGAANRLEYTVIGDPVNEASRLTELAKDRKERVLASSSALYFADEDEQKHWKLADSALLRGRLRKTHLAVPID